MSLQQINVERKTGKERFYADARDLGFSLLDFWQWSASDILNNALRGKLAEFLVAKGLGAAQGVRQEWDAYDVIAADGTKVEVKSAAFLQTWHQNKLSSVGFDIRRTTTWDAGKNIFQGDARRQSDVYVFCLLHHKDKSTVDPMNLDQWTFYVLPTSTLNEHLPSQKHLSLKGLLTLHPQVCKFGELRAGVERVMRR